MSIERTKPTVWEHTYPVNEYNDTQEITATRDGLEIGYDVIPWSELLEAMAIVRADKNERKANGFTLIELLAVITIIGIVLTFMLGAVWMAQESARESATRARVQKLHNIIIDRWEDYRTRRLSFDPVVWCIAMMPAKYGSLNPTVPADRAMVSVQDQNLGKLAAKREQMRFELPDRYEDLVATTAPGHAPTGLRTTYLRRVDAARGRYNAANGTTWGNTITDPDPNRQTALRAREFIDNVLADDGSPVNRNPNECAECLYLIVMAMPADERVSFRDKDYADTNGNFMPEFIDAWGTPIRWLRWAPGVQSDVQIHNPVDYHDPFDPYGLQIGWSQGNLNRLAPPVESGEPTPFNSGSIQVWGFALLPYIYSAGADREFGVHQLLKTTPATTATDLAKNRDPYSRYNSGGYVWRGEPDTSAGVYHHDNITNHQATK